MNETIRTTDERDDEEGLGPEERLRAAARILARGIRRLLTSTAPSIAGVKVPAPSPQPPENTEKGALPVVPSRALMTRTRAG